MTEKIKKPNSTGDQEVEEVQKEIVQEEKEVGLMESLMSKISNFPTAGDLVEGTVIGIDKNSVFIDLPPFGTGIIYGREFMNVRDIVKNLNIGDSIAAKIIDSENKEGYIELSLKEARQALVWSEAEASMQKKQVLELMVKEANKGGLLMSWQGIVGFLPASQLNPEHYPRVTDGEKDRIIEELKKLVGTKLSVQIIGADSKEGKLIFSEKNIDQAEKKEAIEKYKIDDELEGEITGIVDFGVFVKLNNDIEGLVHISEISWSLVENPRDLFKVGDKIKVKIIEIVGGKISLSVKALKENPWKSAGKKYKKDDEVEAVVIKFNKHGALASIEEGVSGLIHISEFENEEKLKEALQLGKNYKFKINVFEPKEQKMTLSLVK
ncbi:S1 RNA-binding domain-containing protein [Patescibacteria group bacterium]|nr:S1 RNA-binding domain-containing protein [Patescibacteria group bacterium]MCG2695167.1 S1 RNA-binding domain-containing protein [Candidatus Parcubacteria bacterium]